MDLALELGMSLVEMDGMPERELRLWAKYASKRHLPRRRLEFYLANLALVTARVAGNKDLTLADFMIDDKPPKKVTADEGANMFANLAQGPGVRILGQGRKKK